MPARPVLIFANPFSGTGPNRATVEAFAQQLRDRGVNPEIIWDPARRRASLEAHSTKPTAEHCKAPEQSNNSPQRPLIVAAGGDGSIAAVLNDMDAAGALHLPFTTLPVGNENLFARYLKIDRENLAPLADALADAPPTTNTRAFDLGRLTQPDGGTRLFSLMLGAGFDADVIHRLDRWRHDTAPAGQLRRVSGASYPMRMLASLGRYPMPTFTLTPDGREPIPAAHAFVFNLPQYGKDLPLCRAAAPDDGRLNYVVFQKPGRLRLLNYLRAAVTEKHLDHPDVKHGTAARLTLESQHPIPLQTDGDPAGHIVPTTTITVEPGVLNVVCPAHADEPRP